MKTKSSLQMIDNRYGIRESRVARVISLVGLLLSIFAYLPFVYAASISGQVTIEGSVPQNPTINMDADPICKAAHTGEVRTEKVIVNENGTLKNVFIYIKEGISEKAEPPKAPATLDQHACIYDPHVMGIQTGQPLSIVNSDATLHNVHALAKQNKEFNLGMPIQGMMLKKSFFNPEVMMKFKCDVHPWMSAYIGVLPHQYYAVTDETGSFEISGLSPGEYKVEAWHETYGTRTAVIKVGGADLKQDFSFNASEIQDEETGVSVKVGKKTPIDLYDDSAALNQPRVKTGWWLPESVSTYSDQIDFLFYLILGLTSIVFVGVQSTLVYFLFKYRAKPGKKAYYTHGSNKAEIIWTAIPAIILVVLAFMGQGVWSQVKSKMPTENENPVQIRIKAEQFAWNIQYPGLDGKFDTADDIKNINQLHIPVGRPVLATLTSKNSGDKPAVLHSFFLPEFRLKQDAVPGMAIDLWFEAKKTGKYEIACAEFCGLGHYRMRGFLSIHSQEGFDAWLKEQAAGA